MAPSTQLQSRLDAGEVLILDGATGTELERLGAPMDYEIWCAAAIGSHPELIRQVHQNYIDAGADIITTNTYASARHAMERAGLADKVREWNVLAAQIAVEARDNHDGPQPVYVAGSVSNYGNWGKADDAALKANYGELTAILVDHGVDAILLEMLSASMQETLPAVEAASECGLPVWVGLSAVVDGESGEVMLGVQESQEHSENTMHFEPFDAAVRKIMAAGGSAVLVMHSDVKATEPALEVCKDNYQGTLGAYANAGYWARPNWAYVDQVTPQEYLAEAKRWAGMGAQIVGGCCGVGPEHVKALRDGLADATP